MPMAPPKAPAPKCTHPGTGAGIEEAADMVELLGLSNVLAEATSEEVFGGAEGVNCVLEEMGEVAKDIVGLLAGELTGE